VPDFGATIRTARELRGWDQAELVRRLAAAGVTVSQQTISRWERGRTRPRGQHLAALTALLGLVPDDERRSPQPSRTRVDPATRGDRPLLTRLRLNELSPEEFEDFAADLATEIFAPARATRVGAQGHKQDGIDVAVTHADGSIIGIQCKREQQFGPAKIKKAVAAVEIDVRSCIIFLSRVASPDARKEMRKHPGWELWDADDLSRAIRRLPRDKALRIVDTFFPGMRAPFLGIPTPGPWQDTAEFYAPLTGDRVYTHRWPLVGQRQALDGLVAAVTSTENRVTALLGRGGIGKSRVLLDVTARLQNAGTEVRFLATGAPVGPADAELLPRGEVLVVVDDAHDRSDLAFLLGSVYRARPEARILLALRPYGWPSCLNALRPFGLHPSDVATIELPDLPTEAAEELARAVLPANAHYLAPYLGAVGTDCPLLIVVGAGLVRRGELDPRELVSSPTMAEEILRRFSVVIAGDGSTPASEFRMEVLKGLAVLQPFRSDTEGFREALSALAGRPYDQVAAELSKLEDAGVALRRGPSLRLVPDLLGDTLLEQAVFDRDGISPTGYVDRVRMVVTGAAFDNALRNATRVDWRASHQRETPDTVIGPLWSALETDFRRSGIAGRRQIAATLQEIAPFQPERVLNLAEWAVDNPTLDGDDSELWGGAPTYDHVLHEIAPALYGVCASVRHVAPAADLLWSLGRADSRPLHQHPNHPVRLLADVAGFQRHKPVSVTSIVIDRVAIWLGDPDVSSTAYSPLEVLRPVLATEGHHQRSDGLTVTFTPFALDPAVVSALRRRVLDLAFSQLGHADVRQAVRAVDVIADGLRYPTGQFGRTVSAEEREAWTPLLVEALDGLRDAVRRQRPDPATQVAIRFALSWHLTYSSTGTKTAAETVRAALSDSVEAQVALHLHDGWNQLGRDLDNYEAADQAHRAQFEATARSLRDRPTESVAELVANRLVADRRAFTDRAGFPTPFLDVLFAELPDVAATVCIVVADDPESPLCEAVPEAVAAAAVADHVRASELVARLAACSDIRIDRQLAAALTRSRRERRAALDGEEDLLLRLAASADPVTRLNLARGGRTLARADQGLAARVLLTIDFSDSTDITDEVLGAFTRRHGYLSWPDVPRPVRSTLVGRLARTPSLDDHQIMLFVAERSADDPDAVLRLLTDRIDRSATEKDGYQPLPYRWHLPLQFRSVPSFGSVLRSIRDWVAASPDSWRRTHYGADLFRAVADDFDDEVVQVLEDGVATGDADQIRAVGALLAEAPRTLVWDRCDVVVRLLQSACAMDPELAKHLASGLQAAAMSGVRSGTPGQPFPEDVEQRDRSRQIAQGLAAGSFERRFYEALVDQAESSIRWHELHDRVDLDGRRW
jgi:transcriptional regulator with XRE-family HTH domain